MISDEMLDRIQRELMDYTENEAMLLNECYNARYCEDDLEKAEYLKTLFQKEYGYWNNWY